MTGKFEDSFDEISSEDKKWFREKLVRGGKFQNWLKETFGNTTSLDLKDENDQMKLLGVFIKMEMLTSFEKHEKLRKSKSKKRSDELGEKIKTLLKNEKGEDGEVEDLDFNEKIRMLNEQFDDKKMRKKKGKPNKTVAEMIAYLNEKED